MSASLGLYRLQVVDNEINEIQARLEIIQQTLEDDEASLRAMEALAAAEIEYEAAVHVLKQAEQEVAKLTTKIEQSESSLYGGSVKNPKELQDLQNEIAALKRHYKTLEERQYEAMEGEERSKRKRQDVENELTQLKQDRSAQFDILESEQSELNKNLERLHTERQAALSPLDSNLLSKYDELRKERNGKAVVTLNDGACSACGTTLTPSQQQSARSASQLFTCPTCGRILYAN